LSLNEIEKLVMSRESALAELQARYADPAVYRSNEALAGLQQEISLLNEELLVLNAAWENRVANQ
jgi:hypothetical protein